MLHDNFNNNFHPLYRKSVDKKTLHFQYFLVLHLYVRFRTNWKLSIERRSSSVGDQNRYLTRFQATKQSSYRYLKARITASRAIYRLETVSPWTTEVLDPLEGYRFSKGGNPRQYTTNVTIVCIECTVSVQRRLPNCACNGRSMRIGLSLSWASTD